jgi:hypothetical protein
MTDDAELLEELVAELFAAALVPPGILLARVQAERDRRVDREGRILADIVVGHGVAHFDGAVGGRIERLQTGDQFTGREDLDLEFVVGHFGDLLRHHLGAAIDGVERLREARCEAPFDLGRGLRDRRRGNGGHRGAGRRNLQKLTTLHSSSPFAGVFPRIPLSIFSGKSLRDSTEDALVQRLSNTVIQPRKTRRTSLPAQLNESSMRHLGPGHRPAYAAAITPCNRSRICVPMAR